MNIMTPNWNSEILWLNMFSSVFKRKWKENLNVKLEKEMSLDLRRPAMPYHAKFSTHEKFAFSHWGTYSKNK